jgi:hypothetical protein
VDTNQSKKDQPKTDIDKEKKQEKSDAETDAEEKKDDQEEVKFEPIVEDMTF